MSVRGVISDLVPLDAIEREATRVYGDRVEISALAAIPAVRGYSIAV